MRKKKLKAPRSLHRLFPQIKDVTDARAPVKVTVNGKDCAIGKKMQASECALAKAAKRQYHAEGAIIGMTFSYIIKGKKAIRFQTPPSVAREIVSFDRHSDFAPGEYHLAAVSPSQRLGSHTKSGPSGPRTNKRVTHERTVRVREIR